MNNKKSDTKKQKKELIDIATERLAEIFIMQLEWKRNRKKKNKKNNS